MRKLFFLLLLNGSLFAQQAATGNLMLTVDEGLSQGMVFDLLQSRDGYLWIATKDGLNRYDGYHCKIFWPNPFDPFSITASEIHQLFEDSHGRLWVWSFGGLDIYLPETGRFFHLTHMDLPGFRPDNKYQFQVGFAESPDGAIWFLIANTLYRIEEPSIAFEAAQRAGNAFPAFQISAVRLPNEQIQLYTVCYSKSHSLLVGTSDGLYGLAPSGNQLVCLALPNIPVKICGEDDAGRIWLRVPDPAIKTTVPQSKYTEYHTWLWNYGIWDGNAVTSLPLKARRIDLFRFDEEKYLWMLTGNNLSKWKPEVLLSGGKPEFEWRFDDPITRVYGFYFPSLTIDRSGIAWAGTNGYGLMKVNPVKPKFTSYLPLIPQRYFMEGPEGWIWAFSTPAILYTSRHFDRSIPNPRWKDDIAAFLMDKEGNGWGFRQESSLFRFDAHTQAMRGFPWKGRGLINNRQSKLLGVAQDGLLRFDPATDQTTLFPFSTPQKFYTLDTYIHCLYEDCEGIVWIFAFEGLIKAVPEGEGYRFEYFKNNPADPGSLFSNFLLSVADDPLEPARYLWIGSKVGLDRMDKKAGTFKHYSTAQGLPDNVIYGILPDNSGHIWLSSNKGLCRFHVRQETVKNFTRADGLQSNEFNQGSYFKTRDGALIFGGVNGVTLFYPDSLHFNEHLPQTQIVGVKVNNEPLEIGRMKTLSLAYDQNFLTIEFAALEFSNSTQNHYRYRLIRHGIFGSQKGENEVELGAQNAVQFANLQPGRYTFQVLGSNNDGFWSTTPAVLEFIIRPPWWSSWWAWMAYLGITVAGALFFYRYQIRRRTEMQETLRLRELDDFKNRFFTNITHEFRTPLTVILGMTERLSGKDRKEIDNGLSLIKRNGENLLRLINQLLDLAKLESKSLKINYEQGDVLAYLRYIAESLHSFANAQNVLLRLESEEAAIVMDYEPERLLQIVYNLLSNAIKFTPSGGRVLLRAALHTAGSAQTLHLTVTDNGAGIPEEDLPHIFDRFFQANNLEKARTGGTGIGLALTRELVVMMGGSIAVESRPGQGTAFTVQLPVSRTAQPVATTAPLSAGNTHAEKQALPTAIPGSNNDDRPQVLLVEDNPDVVEYLKACLEGSEDPGYFLDFAYNGRAGIEKALENIPDLIISDVMMPEKDGFEVCDTLKNDERTSHIPIILLTARADVESRLSGLRRGADAYLTKPFHQEELLLTIRNQLELRKKLQAALRERGIGEARADHSPEETGPEDAFLQKVVAELEKRLDDPDFGVPQLSRKIGLSQSQLYRKIKALTDLSTAAYIRRVRLLKGKHLLETTDLTMAEVAYQVGFNTPNYFSDAFLETFGERPNAMRN